MLAMTDSAIRIYGLGSAVRPARYMTGHPASTVGHRQEGSVDEVKQTQATAEPDATNN